MFRARVFLAASSAALAWGLVSCASVKNMGRGSVEMVKSTTRSLADKAKVPDLAVLIPGGREVGVVKVREGELQEMPTGRERARAFDRERKRSFWVFGGPVDFQEPELPEAGAALDGSLLPPRPN